MSEDGITRPVEFEIIDERGAHRWFGVKCENCGCFPDECYKYCPCCGYELDWSILQEV